MSVWLTIPSKRPPEEAEKTLKLWRERGYKIALAVDAEDYDRYAGRLSMANHWFPMVDYLGYAHAVNHLITTIMKTFPAAEWFIAAGDDVEPDPNKSAEEIAIECKMHFYDADATPVDNGLVTGPDHLWTETFGVMQPTGDRWGDTPQSRQRFGEDRGAYSDRVCGSAWIGREFARRVNQGRGPLWPEYFHMFVDEHLQCVAEKLGVLWQRRDLTHLHRHWGRGPDANPNQMQNADTRMPEFLKRANSAAEWDRARAIFQKHKEAGFAESLSLAD